jgi:hypothetical protein
VLYSVNPPIERPGVLTLPREGLFSPAAMAEEKKTKSAAPTKKPAAAKAAPAKDAAPKVAKAPKGEVTARSKATPAAPEGERCRIEKCTQAVRAKGLCRKHYIGWRRGDVAEAHRYKICTKEACRKPRTHGSLCDEHAGKAVPEAAAPAPAAA